MTEFELIARYFTRPNRSALLGNGDDCAIIAPSLGNAFAVTTDPVSKIRDGLSKRPQTDPLIFQTDTESEFWEMKDSLNVVDSGPAIDGVRMTATEQLFPAATGA